MMEQQAKTAIRPVAFIVAVALAAALQPCVVPAAAQTSPTPGPTNPNAPPNPLSKPGTDLVINPTADQCEEGWRPGLKWTREQFETFCTQIKTSK